MNSIQRRLDHEALCRALAPDRIIHTWLDAKAYYHPMLFGRGYRMIDGVNWHGNREAIGPFAIPHGSSFMPESRYQQNCEDCSRGME